ncbi:MAG: 50S ribosomal protein L23 [Armatimonadota bacterium]|nr:50S ribosomal protein L23 [Armatimonadota bacterium]MCX7776931.1 50S ribosomal protein L23 [Armatimonadota bacterium]MDW8024764.1 50S ribosomal protein L23 [Armatimonadota bacterium]
MTSIRRDPSNIVIRPVLTEKSAKLAAELNQYTFKVRLDATKPEIRRAVEKLFNVDVEWVNVMIVKGKPRGMRWLSRGRTARWKKAIVKVKDGQKIDIFEV